jgi:hypothetical protein
MQATNRKQWLRRGDILLRRSRILGARMSEITDISWKQSTLEWGYQELIRRGIQPGEWWQQRCGIGRVRAVLAKWLSIPPEDAELIDFCLAVYKSHEIDGDPLWGCVIDASGGGKTELLRAFSNLKYAYCLSSLTENTLVSGYRDPKKPQDDPSLLPKLNEKVLIIKDLAPLLSMRRESRSEILGQLRDAYDGFTNQGHGNLGMVHYKARFSLLAASTSAVDRRDAVDQELGERFVRFRAHSNNSQSKARRAMRNIGSDGSMRQEIEQAISGFLDSLPYIGAAKIPEKMLDRLADLADFTAKARSPVPRDRHGDIQYIPRAEVGTRLGKQLGKLLLALAAVRGKASPDEEDFATVQRVANDCLPPGRSLVIWGLRNGKEKPADIEKATKMPHASIARILDDLRALGLVDKVDQDSQNLVESEIAWRLVSY